MSWDLERDKIASYFNTNWDPLDGPVMWENQPFDQPSTVFVSFSLLSSFRSQKSFGSEENLFRNWGTVQIDIFAPENSGTSTSRKLADKISILFLNKTIPTSSNENIQFKVPAISILGIRNGRYRISVSCPFYRTEHLKA